MRWAWLACVVIGCGGAPTSTATSHVAVADALGCTVITRAMIEARRALFDQPTDTEAIRQLLIRRAVARRIADERHIEVTEAEVSEEIRHIVIRHGGAAPPGLDTDAGRADVHDDLLVHRVGIELTSPVSEQAVDDEIARSHGGPRYDVRARLQRSVIDAELDRLAREWMAARTRQTDAGCVESE